MARAAYRTTSPFVLLLLAACTPNNAVLTAGEYYAFLSETTSFSLEKGVIAPEDWSETWNVDCRAFENKKEREALELSDPLNVCLKDDTGGVKTEVESWLSQSPWHVVREDLAPWRGEAVITGENDFQVTFHHRLPSGEDFRFAFVVDPDFGPTECESQPDDSLKAVPVDGDWVANWTEDLRALGELDEVPAQYAVLAPFVDDPNAKLYYMNARGYQFNPGDPEQIWNLPIEWRAGFGAGKFSEEEFHTRSPRWGDPDMYDFFDLFGYTTETDPDLLFFCDMDAGADPAADDCMATEDATVREIADFVGADMKLVGVATEGIGDKGGEGDAKYAPMVHNNFWRVPDGYPSGFDAWVELHYNYVVLSGTPEPGEPLKGAFSMLYDSDDSASRWIVQGQFEVENVRKDRWTTEDLSTLKHEQNGTSSCIAASASEAAGEG